MAELDVPHEVILNFIEEADPQIRSKYSDYREEKLAPYVPISMTSLDKEGNNEIFPLLLASELALKQFQENPTKFIPSFLALKAMGFCFHLDTLEGVEIVDPKGEKVSKTLSEFYGKAIVNDPTSFWDVYFEMEVGSLLRRSELEIKPLDASVTEASGADFFWYSDLTTFQIECKNKHNSTEYEWELERLGREVTDKLWTQHNLKKIIGEDSFAVKVSSDSDISNNLIEDRSKRDELINELSRALASLIEQRGSNIQVEYEGASFDLNLKGYYEGRHRVKLSDEQMSRLNNRENISNILNPFSHIGMQPNVLESNGHGNLYIDNVGGNEIEIFNAFTFELDIPWNIPHHEWVYSTINSVSNQHSDSENIIVFVKIPPAIIEMMKQEKVINHKDEEVSKWERLEERVVGIFAGSKRSDRIKAVVLSTDIVFNKKTREGRDIMLQEALKPIYNKNVIDTIPDEFISVIESKNQIDDVFEMKGRFRLQDQRI